MIDFGGKKRALQALFGPEADTVFLSKDVSTPPRPCVLHGDSVRCEWLREQLFDFDILPLLENTASEEIHVWLKAEAGAHADAGALSSIMVADAKMEHQLYRAGHSLYCEVHPMTESGSVVQGQLRHRYEILIVAHSGFGNETLESTTCVPLAYPVDHEHAEAMCEDLLEVAFMEHIDKRFVQQPKKAWRKEIRGGIMQAFVRAGALQPRYTCKMLLFTWFHCSHCPTKRITIHHSPNILFFVFFDLPSQ